jgi:esterase/lipase superfamily enzyme
MVYWAKGLYNLSDSIDKDSFYNKQIYPIHRIENHVRYDKMICHEIVEKVKIIPNQESIAGCSFECGYHAASSSDIQVM